MTVDSLLFRQKKKIVFTLSGYNLHTASFYFLKIFPGSYTVSDLCENMHTYCFDTSNYFKKGSLFLHSVEKDKNSIVVIEKITNYKSIIRILYATSFAVEFSSYTLKTLNAS